MTDQSSPLRILEGVSPESIPFDELFGSNEPVLIKGLVKDWGLVKAGQESPDAAMSLLESHHSGAAVNAFVAPNAIAARFFYNDDCTGLNFENRRVDLGEIFDQIRREKDCADREYIYINSQNVDNGFVGLREQNDLSFSHKVFDNNQPVAKIWLGTESIASAHYDLPSNIACCVLGKRRFTLFPPAQIHNLYPGPLDLTPAGQVVSMVDIKNPDYERFPRIREALDAAIIVDMEPGDALYYPSMWWHHVEAFAPFNIMINYWWLSSPAYMGNPIDAVMLGMLNIRGRSESEKNAWREVFDYYVFGESEKPREHLPEPVQGMLAELDDLKSRRLRASIKTSLNR